jgi:hypothetical protein
MQTLPVEYTSELEKDFLCRKHLFVMGFSTPQYWTDFGHNLWYAPYWYRSKGIDFPSIEISMNPKVDNTTLNVDDVDRRITEIVLNEDIAGAPVSIYAVALNNDLQIMNVPVLLFYGFCDASSRAIGSETFAINVYNHMIAWKMMTPQRIASPTCQWSFKRGPDYVVGTDSNFYKCIRNNMALAANQPITGANWATYYALAGSSGVPWTEMDWYLQGTCRYTGAETWCDFSWERCLALGNTIHFEGRRWLTDLQDKKIWWGTSADPMVRAYLSRKH